MIEIVNEKLAAEKFAEMFPSKADLQTTFDDMQGERSTKLFEIHEYDHSQIKDKQNIVLWQRERADLLAELPGIKKAAEVITDPRIRSTYEKDMHVKSDKVESLNRRLANKNTSSLVSNTWRYASNKQSIEAMDAWADQVGKWFETGALGEGSVTYNKKTYTYKK